MRTHVEQIRPPHVWQQCLELLDYVLTLTTGGVPPQGYHELNILHMEAHTGIQRNHTAAGERAGYLSAAGRLLPDAEARAEHLTPGVILSGRVSGQGNGAQGHNIRVPGGARKPAVSRSSKTAAVTADRPQCSPRVTRPSSGCQQDEVLHFVTSVH